MNREKFVELNKRLLGLEKEAEVTANQLLRESNALHVLCDAGLALRKLSVKKTSTSLHGRCVITLERSGASEKTRLSAHKFKPGDLGALCLPSQFASSSVVEGVVCRGTDSTISIDTLPHDFDTNRVFCLLKLSNEVTFQRLAQCLTMLEKANPEMPGYAVCQILFREAQFFPPVSELKAAVQNTQFFNPNLNEKQKEAVVMAANDGQRVAIVHGPPGTGKTTVVCEVVMQLVKQGNKFRCNMFLDDLRPRETRVLELWTQRKRQLDQCQQFVLFEASAQKVLDWIREEGEPFLAEHKTPARSRADNEKLLQEYETFKMKVSEQRGRVQLLRQIERGAPASQGGASASAAAQPFAPSTALDLAANNFHASDIKEWVASVQQRYQDLATRLDKYRITLMLSLGKPEGPDPSLLLGRLSDQSLESKLDSADPAKRKSARKIEPPEMLICTPLCNGPFSPSPPCPFIDDSFESTRSPLFDDSPSDSFLSCDDSSPTEDYCSLNLNYRNPQPEPDCMVVTKCSTAFNFPVTKVTAKLLELQCSEEPVLIYRDFDKGYGSAQGYGRGDTVVYRNPDLVHSRLAMQELINTERSYINDLGMCIKHYLDGMLKAGNVPMALRGRENDIFSNIRDIYEFHKTIFVKQLEQYEHLPEDVGHCFVTCAEKLQSLYVPYCINKESSNSLVMGNVAFFQKLQERDGLALPLPAYLIKPVQRIVKYEQLLGELIKCAPEQSELKDAKEFVHNVPLRANHMLHLQSLEGCPYDTESLGDFLVTESFTVWAPKAVKRVALKKPQQRRVFLFDTCLLFAKPVEPGEAKDDGRKGDGKYAFKARFMISEIHLSEHIEGDECKFAFYPGPPPPPDDMRTILKASSREIKEQWVTRIKQLKLQQVLHCENAILFQPSLSHSGSSKKGPDPVTLRASDPAGTASQHLHDNGNMERSRSQPAFHLLNQPTMRKLKTMENVQNSLLPDQEAVASAAASRASKYMNDTASASPLNGPIDVRKTPSLDLHKLKDPKSLSVPSSSGAAKVSPTEPGEEEHPADPDLPPPMGVISAPILLAHPPQTSEGTEAARTDELARKLEDIMTLQNGDLPSRSTPPSTSNRGAPPAIPTRSSPLSKPNTGSQADEPQTSSPVVFRRQHPPPPPPSRCTAPQTQPQTMNVDKRQPNGALPSQGGASPRTKVNPNPPPAVQQKGKVKLLKMNKKSDPKR